MTRGAARIVAPTPAATGAPAGAPALTIDATFVNLGTDTSALRSALAVSSAGRHYTDLAPQHDLPKLPGQASQLGTIAFEVDGAFQLRDAVLTVGTSAERQAVVPLAGSEGLVSLEPRPIQ